jgi:hypothetical protein
VLPPELFVSIFRTKTKVHCKSPFASVETEAHKGSLAGGPTSSK